MSAVEDIGRALLREAGPLVAKSLVDIMRTAVKSKDPGAVARASLAEATKVSADLELRASFAAKSAAKKAVKKAIKP